MAEENDSSERSQQPTERRIQKFKEEGQVPRSRDLNATVILLASCILFFFYGEKLLMELKGTFVPFFSVAPETVVNSKELLSYFTQALLIVLKLLWPFFIVLFIAALGTPILMGGWIFAWKAIAFKVEKINPLKGLKRIFSLKSLLELFKSLLKFMFILSFGLLFIWLKFNHILLLQQLPAAYGITEGLFLTCLAFLATIFATVFISLFDVPLQLWQHMKKLKMTQQEVKDEQKETDGNPEVKRQLRSAQQAILKQRLMVDVPKADLIIRNPTHYAIALRYNKKTDRAPCVIAKGKDWTALKIIEIADDHQIATYAEPMLARSLYASCDIGDEIPHDLYVAVAKVFAYVYSTKKH